MVSSADARAGAIIVAGGAGLRFGGTVRKQFREVAGVPLLLRAVRAFVGHPDIGAVVVVLPPDAAADPPEWLSALEVAIVPGGAERNDSVRAGLAALPAAADPVLIHDGARPLVSAELVARVCAAARAGTAAIAAVPATDTLKEVDDAGCVLRTLDRARIWHAQTPQGFPRATIDRVHRLASAAGVRATDDAALCERFGEPVRVVRGSPENLKVTHPSELVLAEALVRERG